MYRHPVARSGHVAVTSPNRQNMFLLFGCCDVDSAYVDGSKVDVLNMRFNEWSSIDCTGDIPHGLSGACCQMVGYTIYVLMGFWTGNVNTVYALDIRSKRWTLIYPAHPEHVNQANQQPEEDGDGPEEGAPVAGVVDVGGEVGMDPDGEPDNPESHADGHLPHFPPHIPNFELRINQSGAPSPRDKAASWVYKDSIYVFGGFGPPTRSYVTVNDDDAFPARGWNNSLHAFDLRTHQWEHCETSGTSASARAAHTANLVKDRYVAVFGGRHHNQRLNDMHVLDMDTMIWHAVDQPPVDVAWPEKRSWHTMTDLPGDRLLLYGGFSHLEEPLATAWVADVSDIEQCATDEGFGSFSKWRPSWSRLYTPRQYYDYSYRRLWHTAVPSWYPGEVLVFGGCHTNLLDPLQDSVYSNSLATLRTAPPSLYRQCIEEISRFPHRESWGNRDDETWDLRDWAKRLHDIRHLRSVLPASVADDLRAAFTANCRRYYCEDRMCADGIGTLYAHSPGLLPLLDLYECWQGDLQQVDKNDIAELFRSVVN